MKESKSGPVVCKTDGKTVDFKIELEKESCLIAFPYSQLRNVIKALTRLIPPIKISSRKGKGRKLQSWCCERISKLTGIPWGKDELIASREMGQPGPDVRLIGKAREEFAYTIEAKNQEKWSILSYIREAKANLYPDTDWLVVVKRNGIKPLVVMDGEAFFRLLEKVRKR